ncbi:hypothetical protein DXG01_000094 [Tephrocybe rancida]|nr:hypothetical protein DXG01_000094 [Tephrocybe rancida]
MARQGHAFATAQGVRVIYPPGEHVKEDELIDVPRDGKTLGEIVTRGNITMKEYFNDPEATAKAFRGGVFRSGDLAVWYPDGSVAIMDRSKDIIISGGEHAAKWVGRHEQFETDLKKHAKARLPGFACPEWVEVVPDLPVSQYRPSSESVP